MSTEAPVFTQQQMLTLIGLALLAAEGADIGSSWQKMQVRTEAQAVLDGWNAPIGSNNPCPPSDYKLWHLWEAGQEAKKMTPYSSD